MKDLKNILTEKQYAIYKMHQNGHTVYEIAKILGCSRQNIYSLLHKAEEKIKKAGAFNDKAMNDKELIDLFIDARPRTKPNITKIFLNFGGERKSLVEWCKQFDADYDIAYGRYRNGFPFEEIFTERKRKKIDYTIKDDYDLSLISAECVEILQRKNNGETFAEIARDLNQRAEVVRTKAAAAIDRLNNRKTYGYVYGKARYEKFKNDEDFVERKRGYYRKYYHQRLKYDENYKEKKKQYRKEHYRSKRKDSKNTDNEEFSDSTD